ALPGRPGARRRRLGRRRLAAARRRPALGRRVGVLARRLGAHVRPLPRLGVRRVRRVALSVGALVLLGVAAWATGAFATKYAASPARTPCTVLTPGDHTVSVIGVDGMPRDVLLHVPRTGAYSP